MATCHGGTSWGGLFWTPTKSPSHSQVLAQGLTQNRRLCKFAEGTRECLECSYSYVTWKDFVRVFSGWQLAAFNFTLHLDISLAWVFQEENNISCKEWIYSIYLQVPWRKTLIHDRFCWFDQIRSSLFRGQRRIVNLPTPFSSLLLATLVFQKVWPSWNLPRWLYAEVPNPNKMQVFVLPWWSSG